MKIRIIMAIATAATLAACAPVGGPGVSAYYDCGGGTRLKVDPVKGDRVMVQMNDNRPVILVADKAASGARYMSATHQFWDKGGEAMWTVGRMTPMTCQKVALPRGM